MDAFLNDDAAPLAGNSCAQATLLCCCASCCPPRDPLAADAAVDTALAEARLMMLLKVSNASGVRCTFRLRTLMLTQDMSFHKSTSNAPESKDGGEDCIEGGSSRALPPVEATDESKVL
jgi:hypothetical protein